MAYSHCTGTGIGNWTSAIGNNGSWFLSLSRISVNIAPYRVPCTCSSPGSMQCEQAIIDRYICYRTGNHVAEPQLVRSSLTTQTNGYESRMVHPSTSATNSVNVARTVPTGSCRKAGKSRYDKLICSFTKFLA